jgi:hypothetical protein
MRNSETISSFFIISIEMTVNIWKRKELSKNEPWRVCYRKYPLKHPSNLFSSQSWRKFVVDAVTWKVIRQCVHRSFSLLCWYIRPQRFWLRVSCSTLPFPYDAHYKWLSSVTQSIVTLHQSQGTMWRTEWKDRIKERKSEEEEKTMETREQKISGRANTEKVRDREAR